MNKVLLITFGSRGDVQPYIALGKAIAARGATVTLCTSQSFTDGIEEHGLSVAPISIDVEAMMQSAEMEAALRTFSGKIKAMRIGRALVSRQLDETWRVVQQLRPDLIVYHPKAATATYFARALGVPAIPSFLQPGIIPTKMLPPVLLDFPDLGPIGNRVSNALFGQLLELGGRHLVSPWMKAHPELTTGGVISPVDGYCPNKSVMPRLHAFSSELVAKPDDWPKRDLITGAWFLDNDSAQPDAALESFLSSGPPPVYIGFGSMRGKDPDAITRIVIDAVRLSGSRAVLATGWGGLVSAGDQDGIHFIKTVPHDWMFQRCAAVVHHGGAGTTHLCLRSGKPMLVCPVFADQPFWGKRIAALGVGPEPIKMKDMTVTKLTRALVDLRLPDYRTAAESIGNAMRLEGGADQAADVVLSASGRT